MIKIFNANDRDFSTAGNIIIEPIKCIEYKKKSLNGWYIEVELPIKYKEYISKDKLCVVKTKSKLNPQAFRIGEDIEYSTRKIKFKANHVMFDAKDYVLLDVRPTNQNGLNALNYINERTDNVSPFSIYSNVEDVNTAYFIRKNLLEAWATIEERWGGVFDADNWNISFLTSVGNDNGETIVYGKNMQGFDIYEDWSSVCTKLCPVGYDGIMLEETYLESDVQYEKPYTRVVDFQTSLESEEQTEENLLAELRQNAEAYLEENKIPKVSYTVISNINEELEIGDTIKVSHPFVEIFTEVLEYEYDLISNKVKSLTFGNYSKDVKTKFDNIKNSITQINQALSKQEIAINTQTNLINTLNKNGYVYIDDNEILILDALPKETAKNVWRFGLGGIGFSSNGYEGPFETAITMDGQINANFITTGTLNVSRIEGLSGTLSSIEIEMDSITQTVGDQNQKISQVTQTVDELNSKIQDIADITTFGESMYAKVELDGINESEPIQITVKPTVENISYLYPHENLFPSDDLFLKDRKIRFTNKSLEETEPNKYIDYILPDDLLIAPDGTYDEFYLGYDEQVCQITKRCQYNADGTVSKLDAEQIISYEYPKIELKDGDYTIELLGYTNAYLSVRMMAQNIYTTQFYTKAETDSEISQAANKVSISVDEKLSNYSTTTEMRSEINATANAINLEVGKKVNNEDFNGANIMLAINNDISSAVISADKIDIDGKAARFKTEINETYGPYTSADIEIIKQILMGEKVATTEDYEKYDFNKDGEISSSDWLYVSKAVAQTNGYVHFNGTFSIDPYSASKAVSLYNNENQCFSVMLGIINSFFNQLTVGNRIDFSENEGSYISSEGLAQEIERSNGYQTNSLHLQDDSNWFDMRFPNGGSIWMSVNGNDTERATLAISSGLGNQTVLKPDGITTPVVTQTSLEKNKKNFEKLENGLDIVKATDIYKYNLKSQEDTDKKHIGFVIGDNYNYSQEITSQNNDGVDTYSMISVAYKAIQEIEEDREKYKIILQEQQELIEQLQNEIKELKGEN